MDSSKGGDFMNPKRFELDLGGGFALEVDVKRDDCNREPPHCHLTFRE